MSTKQRATTIINAVGDLPAEDVVNLLEEDGLLAADLPEPFEKNKWWGGPHEVARSRWNNVIVFCNAARDTGRIVLAADDARALAHALLAATKNEQPHNEEETQ